MAPDMLLGLDAARGADRTALQIMDVKTGKLVAMSDNVEFHCSPIWTEQELEDISEKLKGFSVSFDVKVNTHKQIRNFRKLRRELGLKEPRIPRKRKKKFKAFMRMTMICWPDSVFSQVCGYSNY